jgi:DNA-binding CsgD family transcriptional regulator/tetratricopeptide (TPR) repeat protein
MDEQESQADQAEARLVGREPETRLLERFFGAEEAHACLVLAGEPGIGKTTLWEAGLEIAAARGYRVLAARTSEAEAGLAFAALADLVDGVGADVLGSLPGPQLRALEVALRRADPAGGAPEPFAISAGFLGVLRTLADRGPLLVAIDDVGWLDASSAGSLFFAARRLSGRGVRFLLSRRPGRPSDLERALQPPGVQCLDVGALSLGALGRVLSRRLGLALPRRVLRQVVEASAGNPLLALELGRTLVEGGVPEIGAELPVPDLADDLFGARARGLPGPARRVLLALALSGGLTRSEACAVVDPLDLEDAVDSGLLVVERGRVRPFHPMLAAATRRHSSARERQELHRDLASAVSDPTLRARHLAMAVGPPDAETANTVSAAARVAVERGAVTDAEELAAHALRLTPLDDAGYAERLLALARCHLAAGDLPRATELLTTRLADLPPGRARAFAHLMLGEAAPLSGEEAQLELALAEAGEDPELRAAVLARKAVVLVVNRVERIDQAEEWAGLALSAARSAGADAELRALPALAWARVLRGRPIESLSRSVPSALAVTSLYESSIERPLGVRLAFRGELEQARPLFLRLLALADARGEVRSALVLRVQICEVELRCGDVRAAARQVDEVDGLIGLEEATTLRSRLRALKAAVAGEPAEAERWAASVLDSDRSSASPGWDRLEANRALGLAALFAHDTGRAAQLLGSVWEHAAREHIDDPGAFPVAADLVEALVGSGDVVAAAEVANRLQLLSEQQQHPWGLLSARRCRAMVDTVDRYVEDAATALVEVAAGYGRLGLEFDRARSLLFLGRLQRRFKRRSVARQSLEGAEAAFGPLGCTGWAGQARAEIAMVSGRRAAGEDELTPSEQRAAELAAAGLSNKEIAVRLFVSVYTVEAHLSHAYAKLGVRSRAQLVHRLRGSG